MYGNNYGYYNPTRNIGVPAQPINNQFMQQPVQNYQQSIQQIQPMVQNSLQGKIVDNADVVKATDIPLDGSTSYFPLTDGSAIVTKKLGLNGISEIVVYKPIFEEKKQEKDQSKYVTIDDFDKKISKLDNSEILNTLSGNIESLTKEIRELKDLKKTRER